MRSPTLAGALVAVLAVGCGSGSQPEFPDLHPVKGVVKRGGQPAAGGALRFTPEPDRPEFIVNAEVKEDGSFILSTVRTTDSRGQRKPGAPAGDYKVTYTPPMGDQTTGPQQGPVDLPAKQTVKAVDNDLTIDLPKQ